MDMIEIICTKISKTKQIFISKLRKILGAVLGWILLPASSALRQELVTYLPWPLVWWLLVDSGHSTPPGSGSHHHTLVLCHAKVGPVAPEEERLGIPSIQRFSRNTCLVWFVWQKKRQWGKYPDLKKAGNDIKHAQKSLSHCGEKSLLALDY